MAEDETVEYLDGEHETMLTYLDNMHHETRGQTIARLEAALKVAKDSPAADLSPVATRTEVVTREVTIDAPAVRVAGQSDPTKLAKGEAWDATDAATAEAKSRKLDLGPVVGTGPSGTVTVSDVKAADAAKVNAKAVEPKPAKAAKSPRTARASKAAKAVNKQVLPAKAAE